MKKTILLIIMLVTMCTLTSCSGGLVSAEIAKPTVGKYHYEVVVGEDNVVNLLNKLDDEKCEVVDIVFMSADWYIVFYKDVEQGGNLV